MGDLPKHRVTFITRTDVHNSDHTPQSRLDNWPETVAGKLAQVGSIADKLGAVAVLDNGDFFDVKSPMRNSHSLVRQVADIHADYPCPVWANVGNHDCVYGKIEFLDGQPLGVLFATGVFQRCYDEYEHVAEDGPVTVRVRGIPYHGTKYDLDRFRIEKGNEDYLVVMAHVLASPTGGTMFEGEDIIRYDRLLDLAPDVDVWVFGHWHKDQGIQQIAPDTWVVNLGSLTRGALSIDDIDRKPAVAVLNFTEQGIEIHRHDIAIEPPKAVFDLERRVQAETRSMTMDAFVTSLRDTLAVQEMDVPIENKISTMDVPDEVRERAILYIEQAK